MILGENQIGSKFFDGTLGDAVKAEWVSFSLFLVANPFRMFAAMVFPF
jgi:hypothetical protein